MARVHAFGDDALGHSDAVDLAARLRRGEVSAAEVEAAALARARAVDPVLHAIVGEPFAEPLRSADPAAPLAGVPTFVKDNTDLAGVPTTHGSEAFRAKPARRDGAYARQFRATGLTVLGKSRLPEFGFNATTEFMTEPAAANPWDPERSVGASSGGAAALVAAGVVPIAHANDGGGSIRIPAACAGLVGLKPTRGRHVHGEQARQLPINVISEGVVTRTVRDTAAFVAAAERAWRNPALPPVGLVEGPADRRLRVGVVLESVTGAVLDDATRDAVERAATVLERAGHVVEPAALPVSEQFADDFVQYWSLLADLATTTGRLLHGLSFDPRRTDGLTKGLRRHHRKHLLRTVGAIRRLRAVPRQYAQLAGRHDLVLSPVLAHVAPPLGHLSPTVPYDELMRRLQEYVAFTPLANVAGAPAMSLPMGLDAAQMPVAVQLSGAHGDERTLLETAFALETQCPFPRIDD